MTNTARAALAGLARHARRPTLLTPDAARDLAGRVRAFDPAADGRPRSWLDRPGALFAKIGGRRAKAFEDGDAQGPAPLTRPRAYAPRWAGEPEAEGEWGWSLVDGVACMEIEGPLLDRGAEFCGAWWHGYDTIALAVREAAARSDVRGIFIRADSPGGVVAGNLSDAAAAIRGARAAAGGKPIWVYADMAASAAYWLAAQADVICAPQFGLVGSIGAVIVHEEFSAALAEAGITVTAIQFGARKTDGAEFKPLSAEAIADLQAEVNDIGAKFVADVVAGRPRLAAAAVIATQAALYMAGQTDPARSGLALGLVDRIEASEQAAFAALQAEISARASRPAPSLSAPPPQPQSVPTAARSPAPAAKAPAGVKETAMPRSTTALGRRALAMILAMTPDERVGEIERILDTDVTSEEKLKLIGEVVNAAEEAPAADPAADPAAPAPADPAAPAAMLAALQAIAAEGAATAKAVAGLQKLAAFPDPKLGAPGGDDERSDADKAAAFVIASAKKARGRA